jgi:hypothetical protein
MSMSAVLRRAPIRVSFGHLDDVFLGAPVMHVLHMTMIEIINMVPVLNGGVATAWAVGVRTCAGSLIGGGHWFCLSWNCRDAGS